MQARRHHVAEHDGLGRINALRQMGQIAVSIIDMKDVCKNPVFEI